MADQDEYEPLARQWKTSYELFVNAVGRSEDLDAECKEIADSALHTVTKMLRVCGGCSLLAKLTNLLWEEHLHMMPGSLFYEDAWPTLLRIYNQLDELATHVADHRIDMIAIRAARTVAVELYQKQLAYTNYQTFHHQVTAQVLKDLIRHSFLDKARAFSVGKRFSAGREAYQFYQAVMRCIENNMQDIVQQFASHPTGTGLRYRSRLFPKQKTSNILDNEYFRMDA
jgi:hypothetical protein